MNELIRQSLGWASVSDRWLPLFSRPGRSLPLRAVRLASHLPPWPLRERLVPSA